ncbi:MAG: hypothetical protein KDK40_01965, partial [Chlamydiia bacterium]|nr:hypothetical protein [Chlamydiia bacterium]
MVGIGIRENFADFYASSNAPRAEKATWGYTIRSAVSTVSKPFIEMGNVLMSSSDHYCKLRDRAAKRAVKQSELYQLTESFQKIIDQMLNTQVKVADQQKALKAFNSLVETSSKSALLDFLSLKTLQLPDDLSEKSVDEISSILYPPIQDRFTEELELAEQLQNQIAFNEIELHRGVISGKFANQMRKSIVKNSSELNRLVKILNRVGLIPDDHQYRAAWLQKFREKAYVQGSNSPEVLEQLQLAEEESLKIYAKRALEIYEDKGNEEGAAFCRQLMHLENAATGTEKALCTSWRSEWKNWIQNHKKELLVAGGILGSCLVAYVSYRYLNNCPPSPQQSDLEEKMKELEKSLQSCNENRENVPTELEKCIAERNRLNNDLANCLQQKKPEPKTSIQTHEILPPKNLTHPPELKWEIKTLKENETLQTRAQKRNLNPTVIE